jgi:addiction module RelE/StbE family toxin
MQFVFSSRFVKKYRKLSISLRRKTDGQLCIFALEPFHPLLDNHPLHGKYRECRSISITGDVRAIYELAAEDLAHFITIGNHSELYE